MAFGLDSTGYLAPRTADLIPLIRDRYEAELVAAGLPADVDWERDTLLGILTAVIASVIGELAEGTQALYDSRDVNAATGVQLHNLGTLVGVTPEPATYSQGNFKVTGTNGTVLPVGSQIEGGGPDGTSRWELVTETTIGAGPSDALFRAVEAGEIRVEAGALEIVTPVAGWSTVYADAAVYGGAPAESDTTFRLRRQASLQIAGSRSLNALRAKLEALDFVTAAVVVDNDTDAAATIGGVVVGRRSVAVVVYPGSLSPEQESTVAQTIYDHLTEGITPSGDVMFMVTGADGFEKTVRFSYATDLLITVAVTVDLAAGYELVDVSDAVVAAVTDYFAGLSVGSAVRRLGILGRLADIEGIDGADVLLNGVAADVIPTLVQHPVINGTPSVTV